MASRRDQTTSRIFTECSPQGPTDKVTLVSFDTICVELNFFVLITHITAHARAMSVVRRAVGTSICLLSFPISVLNLSWFTAQMAIILKASLFVSRRGAVLYIWLVSIFRVHRSFGHMEVRRDDSQSDASGFADVASVAS